MIEAQYKASVQFAIALLLILAWRGNAEVNVWVVLSLAAAWASAYAGHCAASSFDNRDGWLYVGRALIFAAVACAVIGIIVFLRMPL